TKTLEDLVNHSLLAGKVLIFVFSGRDKLFEIIRKVVNPRQMRIDYLFLDSETDLSSTLITLLRRLPSSYSVYDILYLEPGIRLPPGWDVRLAWGAYREKDIATISPMCDWSSLFSLLPSSPVKSSSPIDNLQVDRLVYSCGARTEIEIPAFLPLCVYFRRRALDVIKEDILKIGCQDPALELWILAQVFRRHGFAHILSGHIYVLAAENDHRAGLSRFMARQPEVKAINNAHPFTGLRHVVADALGKGCDGKQLCGLDHIPVQLHVMHSWGGGLENWVGDFCRADDQRLNLVLKSVGTWGCFGQQLALYRHIDDELPLRSWVLDLPIRASSIINLQYRRIIQEIIHDFQVDILLVSSFIGHALDILESGIKTVIVCHDYYPFCPALNISYDGVCEQCDEQRLRLCLAENGHNRFFDNVEVEEWLALRRRFTDLIYDRAVQLIVPSPSVDRCCRQLMPALSDADFRIIPHGLANVQGWKKTKKLPVRKKRKRRIIILGSLAPNKGFTLFETVRKELCRQADLYLVGCGEPGEVFARESGITVMSRYRRESLPGIIAEIDPDMGLLLSTLPETFSYTLSELMFLGVPPVATRLGSFADRIEHGVNGFVYEPERESLLKIVRELFQWEEKLDQVRANLGEMHHRLSEEMVADYHALLPLSTFSSQEYADKLSASEAKEILNRAGNEGSFSLENRPLSDVIEHFYRILNHKIGHTPRLRKWEKYFLQTGAKGIARLLNKVLKFRRERF
ncbi:MAG: glycosyltransferase, partial [Pseudomonadota bacterium]|nr:glycosyltransferase [Pseudomonadota bacterium]